MRTELCYMSVCVQTFRSHWCSTSELQCMCTKRTVCWKSMAVFPIAGTRPDSTDSHLHTPEMRKPTRNFMHRTLMKEKHTNWLGQWIILNLSAHKNIPAPGSFQTIQSRSSSSVPPTASDRPECDWGAKNRDYCIVA